MTTPPAEPIAERIGHDQLLFDSGIVSHGFAPFLRDYDVVVDAPAAKPDGSGSYISGRYRYRFTHCVEAVARTVLTAEDWRKSWDDVLTDYGAWERAGSPEGYVWGVEWALAYPGMSYVGQSERARRWTEGVGREMHEVRIESNALDLTLVFHDLRVDQLAIGDPAPGALDPIE